MAEEAFCDRTYDDSGKITSRALPDALIRDPQKAVQQVLSFISENAVITRSGKRISARIRTFCTHGHEPTGIEVVRAVRESLENNGISMLPLPPYPNNPLVNAGHLLLSRSVSAETD